MLKYEILEQYSDGEVLVLLTGENGGETYAELTFDIEDGFVEVSVSKGRSTSVPYGEQEVEYDNGISVDDVYADEAIALVSTVYSDEDEHPLSVEEAAAAVGLSVDEFEKEMSHIEEAVQVDFTKYYADWYKDNGDFDPYDWME